jgi:hypothetical protein
LPDGAGKGVETVLVALGLVEQVLAGEHPAEARPTGVEGLADGGPGVVVEEVIVKATEALANAGLVNVSLVNVALAAKLDGVEGGGEGPGGESDAEGGVLGDEVIYEGEKFGGEKG